MATILLATDADWLRTEVAAALEGTHEIVGVRTGREVIGAIKAADPDLVLLDLQIGSMGGMAACMAIRLEESGGRLARVPVVMLLDRAADVFLAQRCDADGWLVKPLDARRLRRAVAAVLAGGIYTEGIDVAGSDELPPLADDSPDATPAGDDDSPAGAEVGAAS
ncbi:MAG: response regulator transcription factor [Acidimicrobiia bacterium]